MDIKDTIKNIFTYNEDDEEEVEETVEETEPTPTSEYEKPKSKLTNNVNKTMNIVMFEPRAFEDVPEIAKHLMAKRAAVVNLKKLTPEYKQRTSDFLYGVTYGLRGTTRNIDNDSYLYAPANIGVGGEISQESDEE